MRVITDTGTTIVLGTVEAAPTIGIVDYSRRVTDDFGVTTVVERGFARRMSVRIALPFADVDGVQRRLAELRATSALWVADDRLASLTVRGFYKDFALDLAVPPLSYCTLEVEGLAASEPVVDAGGDPAPDGLPSTLQLLQPVAVTGGVLVASSVAENDAPEWEAGTSYPLGTRVIKAATHRVYESVTAANVGADPAGMSGKWLDVGPTNRWAAFDQALGTVTSADGSIAVTLDVGAAGAVALLDVVAATARVQAPGYDRTIAVGAGAVTFLDLPGTAGAVTVTIGGPGQVSFGTLLIRRLVSLGITESSPTAGITDYSRKEIDDFGAVTIVQRAWAKRMTARALIRTDAVDQVASRIAAVRAQPSLWLGQAGIDSLTVYGFFKDFSIEVGDSVSKLSLSIEGLSTAAKVEPLATSVDWPAVGDPMGTKPADNATVGAPGNTPIGGIRQPDGTYAGTRTAAAVIFDLDLNGRNWFDLATLESTRDALMLARTTLEGQPIGTVVASFKGEFQDEKSATAETFSLIGAKSGDGTGFVLDLASVKVGPTDGGSGPVESFGQRLQSISVTLGSVSGSITDFQRVFVDSQGTVFAKGIFALDVAGRVVGVVTTNNGQVGKIEMVFDAYSFLTPAGNEIFSYSDPAIGGDGRVYLQDVVIRELDVDVVRAKHIVSSAVQQTKYIVLASDVSIARNATTSIVSLVFTKDEAASEIKLQFFGMFSSPDDLQFSGAFVIDGSTSYAAGSVNIVLDTQNSQGRMPITPFLYLSGLAAGQHTIDFTVYNAEVDNFALTVKAGSALEVIELKKGAL